MRSMSHLSVGGASGGTSVLKWNSPSGTWSVRELSGMPRLLRGLGGPPKGHPHAYLLLGVMHLAGRAFPRDDVAAYKWLRLFVAQSTYLGCYSRLARAEHCDRFRLMRVQLDDELGAGLDAAQLAGVQESMEAQRRVVLEGRRHSAALASLRMVREHANRGVASAQREVGRLYLAGGALPRDVVMAHMWLSLAVAAGDADASVLREQLATEMDAEELAEARRLAAR